MSDSHIAINEKNSALYTKFDMKNLDLKTDGTPITYKPEYHMSNVSSEIFPNTSPGTTTNKLSPSRK